MQMSRVVLIFLADLLAIGLTSCGKEFQQVVSIRVSDASGKPSPAVALRYFSNPSCGGSFVSSMTDQRGEAEILRNAIRGTVAVLLEKPSICFRRGNTWHSAWQQAMDPMDHERFTCTRRANESVCKRENGV
jgi:hypothetical protein